MEQFLIQRTEELVWKLLCSLLILLYRVTGGRIWCPMNGTAVLLLTPTSRKTGKQRTVPPLPPAFASATASPAPSPPPDVLSQLVRMQLQIFTLQEHVTRLSLAILQLSLAPATPSAPSPAPAALPPVLEAPPPPRPASRAVPMIAFTTDGYQVVDPDKGILAPTVDSVQWFAWLASTNTPSLFRVDMAPLPPHAAQVI